MKCNHCGSGDSHYDYNEILAIEKENLRLIKEIEEARGEIELEKKKNRTFPCLLVSLFISVIVLGLGIVFLCLSAENSSAVYFGIGLTATIVGAFLSLFLFVIVITYILGRLGFEW